VPVTYLDNSQIVQVLSCLIQNAIKFTGNKGLVRVETVFTGNEIWVKVKDNGAGIPKEELQNIFETFRQVDGSSSRRWGGLGIGLALAKHIVELHKGRVWAESEVGSGSTFTVALPLETEGVFLEGSGRDEVVSSTQGLPGCEEAPATYGNGGSGNLTP
jgi:signal transduction histidine kinase